MRGLFYHFSPAKDVGHGVHLFRLAAALRKSFGGRLSLTLLRDSSVGYPSATDWSYGPVVRLPSGLAANRGKRKLILAKALGASRPDFIVTSFFPLGRTACAPEIMPALAAARAAGIKIYSSAALPYFSWPENELPELFRAAAVYDRIFIHCPPGMDLKYMARAVPFERRVSRGAFLRAFGRLGAKLRFTGYVLPEGLPARGGRGRFLLVHRGGGSTSPEIITCALLARPLLKSRLPMTVVAGPSSSPEEMRRWRGIIKRGKIAGVTLLKETPEFTSLLAGCAAAAGTAGGTAYETLRLGRRAVLIPYTGKPGGGHCDQLARAALLRDLAGASVLDYDGLTPGGLAAALDAALAGPAPSFRAGAGVFNGAAVFAAEIRKDLYV
jgi:predicted glycosyltransferase